jgi:hypothetical protein
MHRLERGASGPSGQGHFYCHCDRGICRCARGNFFGPPSGQMTIWPSGRSPFASVNIVRARTRVWRRPAAARAAGGQDGARWGALMGASGLACKSAITDVDSGTKRPCAEHHLCQSLTRL